MFALGFFGMLGAISAGYSAYVTSYPATSASGGTLSSTEWNKMVQSLQDLDTGIQRAACEARRGVWSSGACQEYAYYGSSYCTYTTCTCNAGYHMCTFPDLFSGGFASLRRPGSDTTAYAWIAGNYTATQDSFFYPSWSAG